MNIICVSDIVEANGQTVRQNNLALVHDIPLGTLVEIGDPEYPDNEPDSNDGVRLFVVKHSRDCDGTPLYDLSFNPNAQVDATKVEEDLKEWRLSNDDVMFRMTYFQHQRVEGAIIRHFGRSSLTVIERTKK